MEGERWPSRNVSTRMRQPGLRLPRFRPKAGPRGRRLCAASFAIRNSNAARSSAARLRHSLSECPGWKPSLRPAEKAVNAILDEIARTTTDRLDSFSAGHRDHATTPPDGFDRRYRTPRPCRGLRGGLRIHGHGALLAADAVGGLPRDRWRRHAQDATHSNSRDRHRVLSRQRH